MPGPLPKPAGARQRRNRTATAATLAAVPEGVRVPDLPERDGGWHPRTVAWWADVWASPMAGEFLTSDVHGLFNLAELEDAFHRSENPRERLDILKELRLQRQAFGLTPMDRRRLQWEVERTEEAREKGRKRRVPRSAPSASDGGSDPRSLLA